MQPLTLVERVDNLERRVTLLEALPERMDRLELQIVQLRAEMHGEFSAVRAETRSGFSEVRAEMRMLHEEVIERIATLQNGTFKARKGPKRRT